MCHVFRMQTSAEPEGKRSRQHMRQIAIIITKDSSNKKQWWSKLAADRSKQNGEKEEEKKNFDCERKVPCFERHTLSLSFSKHSLTTSLSLSLSLSNTPQNYFTHWVSLSLTHTRAHAHTQTLSWRQSWPSKPGPLLAQATDLLQPPKQTCSAMRKWQQLYLDQFFPPDVHFQFLPTSWNAHTLARTVQKDGANWCATAYGW